MLINGGFTKHYKSPFAMKDNDTAEAENQQIQGASTAKEEKVGSLKAGLVHVARKMPKNAHAHFILGLMYQRLSQSQKAISEYEKAEEILLRCEEEIDRPDLLSLVQIHHAQCFFLGNIGDTNLEKDLDTEELNVILTKLKDSIESDIRHAAVWNALGLLLLKTGRVQNSISVLSSMLALCPENLDGLGNLGIAYFYNGELELSERCFQSLIMKDQNHPAALLNYASLLLCKYGSFVAGAGANSAEDITTDRVAAANVAKECLLSALKTEPKAAHIWLNLANVYYMISDQANFSRCLAKAINLDPNCLSSRYSTALHRIKHSEWRQECGEQLSVAGNEMASVLRDGDPSFINPPVAWSGFATALKARHEIASAYETETEKLMEMEEHALHALKQAVAEDRDDVTPWHQLGLHCLRTRRIKMAEKYLKAAVVRSQSCCSSWLNLGVAVLLAGDPCGAEEVLKRALSTARPHQAHAVFSNLGVVFTKMKRNGHAKAMFEKSLELSPGYPPAYNNLGLVSVSEGLWDEAKAFFNRALLSDPTHDAAMSNYVKACAAAAESRESR